MKKTIIVEGVESVWRYHLAPPDRPHQSLCGRATMVTSIPRDQWGHTPPDYHIPQSWCGDCERLVDHE